MQLQAVPPAPLFYRSLQSCLQTALSKGSQDYSHPCPLSEEALRELTWWIDQLNKLNERCLLSQDPSLVIETDASTTEWGAVCQGKRTGGPWSVKEQQMPFNCLELLAASLAVQTFAKSSEDIVILLRMDNTSALTVYQQDGRNGVSSTEHPHARSVDLVHGEANTADSHSPSWRPERNCRRRFASDARQDWMLNPVVFEEINGVRGP